NSRWTGSANKCVVPRVSGHCPGTSVATLAAIHGLPRIFVPRIVSPVPHVTYVRARPARRGSSNSCRGPSKKRYKRRGQCTQPRRGGSAMRGGRVLKERSLKACGLLAHGAVAIEGY